MKNQYKFKFYLNATHAFINNGTMGSIHPHTWEITLYIENMSNEQLPFNEIEKKIEVFLSMYQGQFLNDIPPFDIKNPTAENIGETIFTQCKNVLNKNNWDINSLEISETPSRTYIIKNISDMDADFSNYIFGGSVVKSEENFSAPSKTQEDEKEVENISEEPIIEKEAEQEESIKEVEEVSNEIEEVSKEVEEDNISILPDPKQIYDKKGRLKNRKEASKIETLKINNNHNKNDIKKEEINSKSQTLKTYLLFFLTVVTTMVVSYLVLIFLNRNGIYPWGDDTYGHLFKGHILYNELKEGNIFPLYTSYWYNGVQPYRYWAPLSYYILAALEFLTLGNSVTAYNLFILVMCFISVMGWSLFGFKLKRVWLSIILGFIWFLFPENMAVLFDEGNIPRVVVTTILPYLFYFTWNYIENNDDKSAYFIVIFMILTLMSHIMIAAMVGIVAFMYIFIHGLINKNLKRGLDTIIAMIIGIMITGIYLYPALQGGLMTMDNTAVAEVMKSLTYPISETLNPFFRMNSGVIQRFYFGLSMFIVSILGLILGNKKTFALFLVPLLVLLGTTTVAVPLLSLLPLNQLFWTMRMTPMAITLCLMGILFFKNLKKWIIAIVILIFAIDCYHSFDIVGFNVKEPRVDKGDLITGIENTDQRIALLDLSLYTGFPSYFFSENNVKKVDQVYGWAWQGATTANNIVGLNSALENGYFPYLFDRTKEVGADVAIVYKDAVKTGEFNYLDQCAQQAGYVKIHENELVNTYKLQTEYKSFGTKASYDSFAIGKFATNITYMFPKFKLGKSHYIDDYSYEELINYKNLFLSGFKYRNKQLAERILIDLSDAGVNVVIDATGINSLSKTDKSFLNTIVNDIKFEEFPELYVKDKVIKKSPLPEDVKVWQTVYIENMDDVYGYSIVEDRNYPLYGTKHNNNIKFIGYNLPYYAFYQKSPEHIAILEDAIGMPIGEAPIREIVPIEINYEGNNISIKSDVENVNVALANLDGFKILSGELTDENNLVKMESKELSLQVYYPYLREGLALSSIGIIFLILFIIYIKKRRSKNV